MATKRKRKPKVVIAPPRARRFALPATDESFTVNKRLVWIVGTVFGGGYALLRGGWIVFDLYQRFINLESVVNSNFMLGK